MSEAAILPKNRVLRYTFHERFIHWMAGLSYIYLMLTGLAFWSPWLFWIAVIFGGGTIARELHPWIGLIFVIAVVLMFRMWNTQMHETAVDKEWWDAVGHYIRNEEDEVPTVGRFNGGQKLLFWGFFWCGILLFLSGLILWFPHWIPWNLRFLRYAAVLVHASSALITIGLFIIHVYMGVALERGSFGSVIRGDVSANWAKRYHGIWYDQITRGSAARK
ncbi:MAG: formate dehydrogenase subunit gamma [Candidatus Acidiferrales bacterium]